MFGRFSPYLVVREGDPWYYNWIVKTDALKVVPVIKNLVYRSMEANVIEDIWYICAKLIVLTILSTRWLLLLLLSTLLNFYSHFLPHIEISIKGGALSSVPVSTSVPKIVLFLLLVVKATFWIRIIEFEIDQGQGELLCSFHLFVCYLIISRF